MIEIENPTSYLWATTKPRWDQPRHLVLVSDGTRTLCGLRVHTLYDYATPLLPSCKTCVRAAQSGAAPRTRRQP